MILEQLHQLLGQLLVEEQAHDLRGWSSQGATLAFSRVCQTRPDVLGRELWKIAE